MDGPSVKRPPARVAVVGAPTPDGTRLREALADRGVPGERVDLYGATHGEVVLSEYDGEARIIHDASLEDIAAHDLIFLCERGETARRAAGLAGNGRVVIDVVGALEGDSSPRRIHLDLNPQDADSRTLVAIAHPVGSVLAELLAGLEGPFGVAEALAVVLCPASDFGEPGIEELREQTVRLLSFAAVPVHTFGRQLAFNVIPHGVLPPDAAGIEERRIAADVAELLGWQRPKLSLRLITVPLFYGHGLQLRFRLERPASKDDVTRALGRWAGAGAGEDGDGAPCTPLEVTGSEQVRVAEIVEDGLGGFWIWAVAGETGARGASEAVRLAAELADI
jgi:aspartate-semialdehyde dehydrogenase